MAPECYDAKIGKLTASCHAYHVIHRHAFCTIPYRQMEFQSQEKVDIWAAGCILIVP